MKSYAVKSFMLILLSCEFLNTLLAQTSRAADSTDLTIFNQQIDHSVVKVDTNFLLKAYTDDFVFSHGSGRVDGKSSWLKSVSRGGFSKRDHDSVTVELHGTVAILKGRLNVEKKGKEKVDRYWLRYIRVYVKTNRQWQMISHMTTAEFHLPE